MTTTKTGVKKARKRPSKAPKTAVGVVLLGAARRLELNPDREECQCDDLRRGVLTEPAASDGWCPFCAIERERIDQEEPRLLADTARDLLAFAIDGEVYLAGEEVERDTLILGFWETEPTEVVIETFKAAVASVEGGSARG